MQRRVREEAAHGQEHGVRAVERQVQAEAVRLALRLHDDEHGLVRGEVDVRLQRRAQQPGRAGADLGRDRHVHLPVVVGVVPRLAVLPHAAAHDVLAALGEALHACKNPDSCMERVSVRVCSTTSTRTQHVHVYDKCSNAGTCVHRAPYVAVGALERVLLRLGARQQARARARPARERELGEHVDEAAVGLGVGPERGAALRAAPDVARVELACELSRCMLWILHAYYKRGYSKVIACRAYQTKVRTAALGAKVVHVLAHEQRRPRVRDVGRKELHAQLAAVLLVFPALPGAHRAVCPGARTCLYCTTARLVPPRMLSALNLKRKRFDKHAHAHHTARMRASVVFWPRAPTC